MPWAVPSDFQNWRPFMRSSAAKYSVPSTTVRSRAKILEHPERCPSPERCRRASHRSSTARSRRRRRRPRKNSRPLTSVKASASNPTSLSGMVPSAVPSLFQSWILSPSLTVKNSVPLTLVRESGSEPGLPKLISLTSWGIKDNSRRSSSGSTHNREHDPGSPRPLPRRGPPSSGEPSVSRTDFMFWPSCERVETEDGL